MDTYVGDVHELVVCCVTGPDAGRRFVVGNDPVMLGSAGGCHVASDDPEVGPRHIAFALEDRRLVFRTVERDDVFLDGQQVSRGRLRPGQQLRIGRSIWQLADEETAAQFIGWIGRVGGRVATAAGVGPIEGFSFAKMFADVFKRRRDEEIEEYLDVGVPTTTPAVAAIDTSWPRPWLFARCAALSVVIYFAFSWATGFWGNPLLLPGMIGVGAFAIPLSVLLFFIEVNVPRNISLYQVFKLFLVGAIVSLVTTMVFNGAFGFILRHLPVAWQPVSAGPIEELAKLIALLVVVRRLKYRWTMNGLLFGAIVGCGFAAFETAGYALVHGLLMPLQSDAPLDSTRTIILLRGVLTLAGSHIAWTAIVGAALWRVRGQHVFRFSMLWDPRFLRAFGIAVLLHMLWNAPYPSGLGPLAWAKYAILGFVAWAVVFAFIHDGLRQIRAAQSELAMASEEVVRTIFSDREAARPVAVEPPPGATLGGTPEATIVPEDHDDDW